MFEQLSHQVKLVEVGPRDGLQNEKGLLTTSDKLVFIQKLLDAGVTSMEVTSFVRGDRIPQMQDASLLYAKLLTLPSNSALYALIPNQRGLQEALKSQVNAVAFFTATSETFNQKNINRSIDHSLQEIAQMKKSITDSSIKIRAYVSTVFGCPYEGEIAISQVVKVVKCLHNLGIEEISLGDTIGVATPLQVKKVLLALKSEVPVKNLALHFHDTRGLALANILTGLEYGVQIFDASSGGLGGCPYAQGASGNVASEEVIFLLNSLGISCGIDLQKLLEASTFVLEKLGKKSPSKLVNLLLTHGRKN